MFALKFSLIEKHTLHEFGPEKRPILSEVKSVRRGGRCGPKTLPL